MGKVVYLEFEEDCTLDEIKAELLRFKDINQVACTDINGERVFSDDQNIHETFERISLGIPKKYSEQYKKLNERRSFTQENIVRIETMKQDNAYTFYYGVAKSFIKEDLLEQYERFMLFRHSISPKIIIVIAKLLIALEQPSKIECLNSINHIIELLKTDNEEEFQNRNILQIAIKDAITYGKKGELLTEFFSPEVFSDIESIIKDEEKRIEDDISKLTKKHK